jgi:hypothetical protein
VFASVVQWTRPSTPSGAATCSPPLNDLHGLDLAHTDSAWHKMGAVFSLMAPWSLGPKVTRSICNYSAPMRDRNHRVSCVQVESIVDELLWSVRNAETLWLHNNPM